MTYYNLFVSIFQNADDNSYPSEVGVIPALAFVVERDSISVLNNEIGFQETNIRAICDVGRSTKGKHKYGYIGKYLHDGLKELRKPRLIVWSVQAFVTRGYTECMKLENVTLSKHGLFMIPIVLLLIGQKGIGFKSVFKVTDHPEIHSNGFHLRFDKTCGPMGYILPHWTEDEKLLDSQLKDMNQHRLDDW